MRTRTRKPARKFPGSATAATVSAVLLACLAGTSVAAGTDPEQPTDVSVYENRPVSRVVFRSPANQQGERAPLSERAAQEARNTARTVRGSILDAATLAGDARRLNRLGLFSTVETYAALNDDGTVTVVFEVAERAQVIDVQVVGNTKINDGEIAGVVDVIAGTPVDRFQIDRSARRIEDLYRRKGYAFARVTVDEEELQDAGVLIYRIREGDRLKVTAIRFEGNAAFTPGQLRREIETKEANLFRKGQLDEDTLDTDIGNLITFYRNRGYLDIRADRIVQPSPDGREAIVTYVIEEGPLYTLRSVGTDTVTASGPAVLTAEQVAGLIVIKPGDVYGIQRLDDSVTLITNALGQMGYADVEVIRVEKRDPNNPVVDLIFVIDEGPRSYTGEVVIQGNDLTRQEVVRRQVQLKPMRPLDTTAISRTQRQLRRLRLFNDRPGVRVTPLDPGVEFYAEVWNDGSQPQNGEGDPDTPQAIDLTIDRDRVYRDVLVEVEETNTGRFDFGGAVSSDSGLVGRIAIVQNNFDIRDTPDSVGEFFSGRSFRGGGQTFQLELLPGDEIETYTLGLTEPYLFESDYSGSASVFFRRRDFDEYDEERVGARFGLGRRFGTRWTGNLSLRAESVELSDLTPDRPVDVFAVADKNTLFGISGSLSRSTIDNVFRPTRGSRTSLELEQVVGDFEFTKINARHVVFIPIREDYLGRSTILSLTGDVGYIPQGRDDTPTYERFFLGGQTFRGFEFRTVSPKGIRNDNMMPSDDPVGGTFQFFLGAEVEQPIFEEFISVVGFIDTGTVTFDPGFDDYRVSVGFGMRIYVPALSPAPLAFDFGFPIVDEDTDESRLFTFTIDLPF